MPESAEGLRGNCELMRSYLLKAESGGGSGEASSGIFALKTWILK